MSVLYSVLALAITLGILVTIHEYGHYWVARRCGVKVLKFSVGFGKVLYSKTNKNGCEFAVAAIPLGGYVKMLDEREGAVDPELLDQAFNRKTVWQRMAVVLAGPAANILFAIFAYWIMFMTGVTQIKPVIGAIEENSLAFESGIKAGEQITAIDGKAVTSWQGVQYGLLKRLGDTGEIQFLTDTRKNYSVTIERWLSDKEEPNTLAEIGITPYRPDIPAILAELQPGLPAEQAGLKSGDKIHTVNGQVIEQWFDFVDQVKANPEIALSLTVLRDGNKVNLTLIPAAKKAENGEKYGFAGAMVESPKLPDSFITVQSFGVFESFTKAAYKTWDMSIVTLESIGKMIQGLLSVKNLSGPITIAKVANASAQAGFEAFIGFLAYISVMLAVVNLLPIPVLDGGHFLYYLIEAVKGSPVSEKVQLAGMRLGMALLMMVMFVAIFNDISRI
ncbi:sigma E protease regulator RseP [Oceaniserpentilla sp. 4NH20-0058]|uniref:sigma E protease regulator RseP n=1 Tax=Oceaniserpentilla sp. 4NH20-0058 TaxID=3127660 RepID=UPI003103A856